MIYINTYSNIIYQTSQQRCTRLPCIPKERRECPTAAWNISLPVKKREKIHFIWKNIYRAIFVFQEQRWRCLQMWKSEETNIPRKLKMLLGVVQSTLYQVQGTLYQVLGTGWTGVAKHSKAQVPKILLGAIPHSTSWLDISHLQSVL